MKIKFIPTIDEVASFDGIADQSLFAKEQPVFSSSPEFAREVGGELSKRILDSWDWKDGFFNLNLRQKYPIIDTRVQRLMPGMYPSIPGWHCDAVPRPSYDAQPDLTKIDPEVKHYTALISTSPDISNTEFVVEPIELELDPSSQVPIWKQAHIGIEKNRPKTMFIKPGILYRFDQLTLHKTSPTLKRGWRMFFRLSMYHNKPLNQKSGSMQVYLLSEENGW